LIFVEAISYCVQISQEIRGIRVTIPNPFQDSYVVVLDACLVEMEQKGSNGKAVAEHRGAGREQHASPLQGFVPSE
jgi:hypothetical protein